MCQYRKELACLICGCLLHTRSRLTTNMLRRRRLLAPPTTRTSDLNEGGHFDTPEDAGGTSATAAVEDSLSSVVASDASCANAAKFATDVSDSDGVASADRGLLCREKPADDRLKFVRNDSAQNFTADARVHAAIDAETEAHDMVAPMLTVDANSWPTKRRKSGASGAEGAGQRRYATIDTEVRALYESGKTCPSPCMPLLTLRKAWPESRFDSFRLRALERSSLQGCGGSGLTLEDHARLYDLLDIWNGTKPGMPVDATSGCA